MSHEDLVTIKAFLIALESLDQPDLGVITVEQAAPAKHSIQELGWTREQAAAIRYRLVSFGEDWEAPGVEVYDDL